MYIVTTSNRTYQKLIFSFLAGTLLLGGLSHLFYQTYYVNAELRKQQLLSVVAGNEELQAQWINPQRLRHDGQTLVYAELLADLQQTNHPDPEQGALQMLPLATQFFSDNELFRAWLQEHLQGLPASGEVGGDASQVTQSTLRRKHFKVSHACMSIERKSASWQLVALAYCG